MTIDIALTHTVFLRACDKYLRKIVLEYCELSLLDVLTDAQTLKVSSILKDAETDPLLSFLLDEADHVVGHLTNFVDVKEVRSEQDELKQLIDKTWQEWLLNKAQSGDLSLLTPRVLKQAQSQLKECGLYTADVDGVYGEKTKEAFQRLGRGDRFSIEVNPACCATSDQNNAAHTKSPTNVDIDKDTIRSAEVISWITDPSVTVTEGLI